MIAGGIYYFFTSSYPFEKASAENVGTLDSFLLKNYFFTLNLDKKLEEAIRVACIEGEDDESVGYPCQNENPGHKIVIGWARIGESYMDTMESLTNEQLYWKMYPIEQVLTGNVSCKERVDYPYYRGSVYGMDCITVTDSREVLYSSVLFLQPEELTGKKVFIAVLNTSKTTSAQEVENELLLLVSKLKVSSNALSLKEFFAVTPKLTDNVAGRASSTSEHATQAHMPSPANSSNTVTRNTGDDIDATVCDAVDQTKCYPIYCESRTAVWNYSLNKCIEPSIGTVSNSNASSTCPEATPVWDGSKCRELAGDVISDNRCLIPVGGDSCEMEVFWSSHSIKGNVEVRLPVDGRETVLIGTGLSGKVKHVFTYRTSPYTVELYDITGKLNEGRFTTVCASGGYDPITKKCADPQIEKVEISGEYYASPGSLKVVCSHASRYLVRNTDTSLVVASGTYTAESSAPLDKTGNYSVVCIEGERTSVPSVRYYNAPPPPPTSFSPLLSPITLLKHQKTIINWNIQYPLDSCKLRVEVVCEEKKECKPEQVEFENSINEILSTELTDENDPGTSRPIAEAVRTVAKEHINKGWFAVGQKTLLFNDTADVILSCGDKQEKKRVYVRTVSHSTSEE